MPKRVRESSSSESNRCKRVRSCGQPQFLGLESAGLEPVYVEADGACFFRAVSDQFCGSQEQYGRIRESAVYHMMHHRSEFQPFLAPEEQPTRSSRKSNCHSPPVDEENANKNFDRHLKRMRRPHTWATHLEVQATANCFGLEIHIHRPDQRTARIIEGSTGQLQRIDICFDPDAQHYWST